MNANFTRGEIATGYAAAIVTLCLGVSTSVMIGGEGGTQVIRASYILAGLIVVRVTFAWGRIRGFPLQSDGGGIAISHVIRNLTMAAIACVVLLFIAAPFMSLAFELAQ